MKKMFLMAVMAAAVSVSFGYEMPQSQKDCILNCKNERNCDGYESPKGISHCNHSCVLYCAMPNPTPIKPTPVQPSPIKPMPVPPTPSLRP